VIGFFLLLVCTTSKSAPIENGTTTDQTSDQEMTDIVIIKDKLEDGLMPSPTVRGPIDLVVDAVVGIVKSIRDEFQKQSKYYNSMPKEEYMNTLLFASS
ncbi:hypothetical protein PMAYCL1PPCAC_27987, partial [Pristionchus mayeri]